MATPFSPETTASQGTTALQGATRRDDTMPPLRAVRFTFDFEVGALRRKEVSVLAGRMCDAGLDVSWTDTRSGLFGRVRRFTVTGSASLVGKLVAELARSIGWQPGPIALPGAWRT